MNFLLIGYTPFFYLWILSASPSVPWARSRRHVSFLKLGASHDVKRFFELSSSWYLQLLMCSCQVRLPIACCVLCAVHTFSTDQLSALAPILSSTGRRTSTSLWALAWKDARDTSMCMIENVCLWFAAIELKALDASNGGVPAYRSGRSSLSNSLGTIRDFDLHGLCPSSNLFVSTDFESAWVTWYFAMASRSSTFSCTPRSRKYLNSCSRAWRTSCHGNSLPVTSLTRKARWYFPTTYANIHRFGRLRLARPSMVDLHRFSSSWTFLSSSVLEFSKFLTFPFFHFWLHPSRCSSNFWLLPNFPHSLLFTSPVASVSTLSLLICSATHLLFVITLIPSASMDFSWPPRNSVLILASFQIADS